MRSRGSGRSGWWLLVVVAAGVSAVSWLASLLPGLVGGALVATGAAVGAVLSQRGKQLIDEGVLHALETREKLLRDPRGRLPRVRDIEDLIAVGVHPAAPAGSARTVTSKVTPFVRRDRSEEIEAALRTHDFVLVVGESTAGKTRAAFEAARTVLPRHAFIAPDPADRTSLRAAVAAVRGRSRCLVWLDDVERYLGSDGLTPYALHKLTRSPGSREVVVLGTIRAHQRSRYNSVEDGDADASARFDQRTGRDVLALAHEIRLDRRWDPDEVARARAFRNDERIAHAIGIAGRYGIAEFLAAGPQLLTAWQDAWAPEGGHTRGAALVTAAVEARRAGWAHPLPTALLRDLHERHLAARGGFGLRPESWEEAVAWATTPLYATSSMLLPLDPSGDAHYVFDYLPDAVDASPEGAPIPEETWTRLIAEADPATCEAIGWEAVRRTRYTAARTAFQKALDAGVVTGAVGLARVLGEARQVQEACRVLRTALGSVPAETDPDALLALRRALAWWSGGAGHTEEALAMARAVHEEYARRYGDEHRATLEAALITARWLGATGRTSEALGLALDTGQRSLRVLGAEHRTTLDGRFEVAIWTGESGQPAEAARLWGELDEDAGRLLGERDKLTNDVRWNRAAVAADTGDTALALDLLTGVVEGRAALYGDAHPWTLAGRLELAGRTGRAGRTEEALALATTVTTDCVRSLGHAHELTLAGRHQQALWTARSGRSEEAGELFAALLADCGRLLGPDHPLTEGCRSQLAQPGRAAWYYELPSW
ncbi:hypothetical protein [Streptomyces sp. NPDC048340]|uniref:hypothetical protein n=1 Tax=Streptomyces sp. NPDC048340 TaxID=3365537 RepID=UPI003717E9F4